MPTSRRFSDEEVRAIFERAAERQEEARRAESGSTGQLTLEELQEIGAASGIDPAHIAAAVADLNNPASVTRPRTEAFLGMPSTLYAERFIPTTIPDEAWEQIVPELRRIFKTDGIGGEVGRMREWTSRPSQGRSDRAAKVTLIPEDGGTRVTIEQSAKGAALGLTIASAVYLLMGVLMMSGSLVSSSPDAPPFAVGLVFSLLALALFGGTQFGLRLYGRTQHTRFEQALDRIELITRATASEPASSPDGLQRPAPSGARTLDLDALPDAPDSARGSSSDRTRA